MTVRDNAAESRYEITDGGDVVGFIAYRDDDRGRALVHTEVDDAHEGKGVATSLVAGALDDARANGLQVQPLCSFVAAFVDQHPEYSDVVA